MPQKYQNEKSPILKGQKKPKTPGKVQKLSDLGGPTSINPFENTLYRRSVLKQGLARYEEKLAAGKEEEGEVQSNRYYQW